MAFLDPILNPILLPLASMSPLFSLLILSFVLSLVITIAYKYTTDQDLMKSLKDELKGFQDQMKDAGEDTSELMRIQKLAMEKNFEFMKHTMKSTLYTIIPLILIFGWMGATFDTAPMMQDETFVINAFFSEGVSGAAILDVGSNTEFARSSTSSSEIVDGVASWSLRSKKSDIMTVNYESLSVPVEVIVSEDFLPTEHTLDGKGDITSVTIAYPDLDPLGNLNLFGWTPGWLAIYIISSIIFNLGLRKLMNIH